MSTSPYLISTTPSLSHDTGHYLPAAPPEPQGLQQRRIRRPPQLQERLLAEGLGVFLILTTVGLNAEQPNTVVASVSGGLILMSLIYCFGSVSGGHFNPAVSLGFSLTNPQHSSAPTTTSTSFSFSDLSGYVGAQMFGALCGAIVSDKAFSPSADQPQPAPPFPLSLRALMLDLLFTSVLVLVMLRTREDCGSEGRQQEGWMAGMVVTGAAMASSHHGEVYLNPTIPFGQSMVQLYDSHSPPLPVIVRLLAFTAIHTLAALIAAALHRLLWPSSHQYDGSLQCRSTSCAGLWESHRREYMEAGFDRVSFLDA